MTPASSSAKELPWYFAPMIVLITGCIVAVINRGIGASFGLFTLPISDANGWPRETYSLAIAIQNLLWGIGTPVAGMLADRYGAARVIMLGALFYCLGIVFMASTSVPILFQLSAGVLVGVGIAFSSFGIIMAALARIVPPEKRSWAFGLATAAASLGQFIFAPLVATLISAYGWHFTLLVLAGVTLIIIPFALPLMVSNASAGKVDSGETKMSMREAIFAAFGYRSYALLVSGFFVCGFQLAFITVHLPPYLAEHGISKEFAGLAMGSIGLFNAVGSYMAGIIGGRREKRVPLSIIYLLRSIAVTAFILMPITPVTTIIFTATMGFLWLSTVPLTMGLVKDMIERVLRV